MLRSAPCTSSPSIPSASPKRLLWQIFSKQYGLTLTSDLLDYLLTFIQHNNLEESEYGPLMTQVASTYAARLDRAVIPSITDIDNVINNLLKKQESQSQTQTDGAILLDHRPYCHVINAHDHLRWCYNPHQQRFILENEQANYTGLTNKHCSIFGTAKNKTSILLHRYNLLRDRLCSDSFYSSQKINSCTTLPQFISIKMAKSKPPEDMVTVYGMLTQLSEQDFGLEDEEDVIVLHGLETADIVGGGGIFCEGVMCLITGYVVPEDEMEVDVSISTTPQQQAGGISVKILLDVAEIRMPPPIPRQKTLTTSSYPDIFRSIIGLEESMDTLRVLEKRLSTYIYNSSHGCGDSILILSEVWLDQPETLDMLYKMLKKVKPAICVLIGKFLSKPPPLGPRALDSYKAAFTALAKVLIRLDHLTKYVLCPSKEDSWSFRGLLPSIPIPAELFSSVFINLTSMIPLDVNMASNPTRITFYTQEIFVLSENLTQRILMGAMLPPTSNPAIHLQMIKTIADQAHAHPFIPTSLPSNSSIPSATFAFSSIIWSQEHVMRLCPLPDLAILSESIPAYVWEYSGTWWANPGPFVTSDGTGVIYDPVLRICQLVHIDT